MKAIEFVQIQPTAIEQEFRRLLMERERALFEYRLDPDLFPLPEPNDTADALAYALLTQPT